MEKCIHSLHYTVVFRDAISIWKTQRKVQEASSALHLLLKQPMWELSDDTISFFCVHVSTAKEQNAIAGIPFTRHDILHQLCTWCKDHERSQWNPNTASIITSQCHTLFWPSVRTPWSPIIYAESGKSNLYRVDLFSQMKNICLGTCFMSSA